MGPPAAWLASPASDGITGCRFIARDWDTSLPPAEAGPDTMSARANIAAARISDLQCGLCMASLLVRLTPGEETTLVTVEDVETRCRGVVVFYDADDPCAAAWVKQAEAISAELWQTMAVRRKGVGR